MIGTIRWFEVTVQEEGIEHRIYRKQGRGRDVRDPERGTR